MQQLYEEWKNLYYTPTATTNNNNHHPHNNTTNNYTTHSDKSPTIKFLTAVTTTSPTTNPTMDTNIPYQIMLQLYSGGIQPPPQRVDPYDSHSSPTTSTTTGGPTQSSLQILQDWELVLGGNLELTPRSKHYQMVLHHYAHHCTQVVKMATTTTTHHHHNNKHHSSTPSFSTPYPDAIVPTLLYPEAIDVALEIMEHLQQTYHYPYDDNDDDEYGKDLMYPNLSSSTSTLTSAVDTTTTNMMVHRKTTKPIPNIYTYHYVVRCIASAIKFHGKDGGMKDYHNSNNNNNNNHPMDDMGFDSATTTPDVTIELLEQHYEQLQTVMDLVIQEFRASHPGSNKNNNNNPTMMKQKNGTIITNDEFNTFLLCLSDAIQSCQYISRWKFHQAQSLQKQAPPLGAESILNHTTEANHNTRRLHQQRRQEWFSYWWSLMDVGNVDIWLNLHDSLLLPTHEQQQQSQHAALPNMDGTLISSSNNNTSSNIASHQPHPQGYFNIIEKTTAAIIDIMGMELQGAVREISTSVLPIRDNYNQGIHSNDHTTTPPPLPTPPTISLDDCIGMLETMTQGIIRLEDMVQSKTTLRVALPSGRHYSALISSWSTLFKCNRFIQLHGTQQNGLASTAASTGMQALNTTSYEIVIRQQENSLLQRFSNQHSKLYSKPKHAEHTHATNSWNQLMQSCITAHQPDRVLELWQDNNHVEFGRIRKNQESYDILFRAYCAKRGTDQEFQDKAQKEDKARQRAQQAHSTLSKLFGYDPNLRKFEPTSEHFLAVMLAWSRSYDYNAAIYCQQIFDRMVLESERIRSIYGPLEDLRDSTLDTFVPTAEHYRPLLTCWGYSRLPEATKRILHIYQEMKRAGFSFDQRTYSTIVFALSRTKRVDGAEHAEQILDELENKGFTSTTTNTLNEDFDTPLTELQLIPSIYRSCMHAWCYCGAPDAHKRCALIFRRLLNAYEKSGWDISLRPDSAVYAILIDSMTLDSSIVDKRDVAVQAEKILEQMEAQAAAGIAVSPSVRVYTAVMKAHCKSGDPDAALKVEELIRRMKVAYETGNIHAKPDSHAMTLLLQSWGRSNVPNKAAIAWGIHKQMEEAYDRGDLDMRPTPYSLGAILSACAYTNTTETEIKNDTVKIALMTLNELDKITDGALSDFAFRHTFQVITSQIDNKAERAMHARVVFQRCCEAGFVSDSTIEMLRKDVPSLYFKLPKSSDEKLLVPKSWSRNIQRMARLFQSE